MAKNYKRAQAAVLGAFLMGTPAFAQTGGIVAGQTAGMQYVDIVPDITLSYTTTNCCTTLDLDGDGANDVSVSTEIVSTGEKAEITILNPNMTGAHVLGGGYNMTSAVRNGDAVSNPFASPPYSTLFIWDAPSPSLRTYALSVRLGNPPRQTQYGYWTDGYYGVNYYMPIALYSSGFVRYGWIKMIKNAQYTFTIDSYALQPATPLATATGRPALDVQVYPNPSDDLLYFQTSTPAPFTVTVTNSLGQTLMTQQLSTKEALSLAKLPAGLYSLRIESSAGITTRRIQKN